MAQGQAPTNIRIHPSEVTQTEPSLAVSPVDTNLLFASAVTINTNNGFKSEGVYWSTTGGTTWAGWDSCFGQSISNHGGDPGPMIHSNGRFILTHIGLVFPGVYSHYSTDCGLTWSAAATLSSDQPEDKGSSAIDNHPSSPFYGRLYSAWVSLVIPYPVRFSNSTNAGTSWIPSIAINGAPPARSSGGTIATGTDGRVYVTWAGMTQSPPLIENFVGFAFSTDGGLAWNVSQNAFDINGINGTLSTKGNIRVNGLPQIAIDNSGGPRHDWLYIVTTEKALAPAGTDPDVILHRSTDRGQSWSPGIRVNQDPLNNGKIQYFPAMDIDDDGRVNIVYYDDRNTAADSAEIVLAQSSDGGATWGERIISDHRCKPKPVLGGASNYQGDHIAMKAVGRKLYALWMDDFSGIYQTWQAIISLDLTEVRSETGAPDQPTLSQNYPNPFNPKTTLSYSLHRRARVVLSVCDILGQNVAILYDDIQAAGSHEAVWEGTNGLGRQMASGVYFYRMQATPSDGSPPFVSVKKMLLMR
jgi:hypothetical protein